MAALANPFRRGSGGGVCPSNKAMPLEGQTALAWWWCLWAVCFRCLASQKPSDREFFVPASMDLAVKLLTPCGAHICVSFFNELCDRLWWLHVCDRRVIPVKLPPSNQTIKLRIKFCLFSLYMYGRFSISGRSRTSAIGCRQVACPGYGASLGGPKTLKHIILRVFRCPIYKNLRWLLVYDT